MTDSARSTVTPGFQVVRFLAALSLLVAIALLGVSLDNRSLELKRRVSLDTFRADQLEAQAARLSLQIEQLQTPQRLKSALESPLTPVSR